MSIAVDENGDVVDGKTNAFNMKDYSSMLRTFGTDYMVKDDVPNILTDKINWKS